MPNSRSSAAVVDEEQSATAQEVVQRPLAAWSDCITTGLVNGAPALVPLSQKYIEWLDQNFPDGP